MTLVVWIVIICLPIITLNQLISLWLNVTKADEWELHKQLIRQSDAIHSKLSEIETKME